MAQAARKKDDTAVSNANDSHAAEGEGNTKDLLGSAVHKSSPISARGFQERLFTLAFRGFVYPQIWEDPEVDLEALKVVKDKSRIMTIASGGCNIMNYLTVSPAAVKAIDLNPAHISLARLKLCAAKHLPGYHSFFQFFAHADSKDNIRLYNQYIKPNLDPFSRKYWEGRRLTGEKRINYFRKNIYQFGLLGRFISAVHIVAKMYGRDPREILTATNMNFQSHARADLPEEICASHLQYAACAIRAGHPTVTI